MKTVFQSVMRSVYTIRLPKELREKMKRYNVNWSGEIREYITERIKELELAETIKEVRERAKKRKVRVDSTVLIREDRDSR